MLSCIVICRNTDKKPYDNTTDGGGPKKLSDAFGIPLARAKKLIANYYNTFKELKPFFERKAKETKALGYILINDVTKRKSYVAEYEEYDALRQLAHRLAVLGDLLPDDLQRRFEYLDAVISRHSNNFPIQGTAADMAKLAGIYLRQAAKETRLFTIPLLIHDEYMAECNIEDALKVKEIMEGCMLRASKVFLTSLIIPADGKITKYWSK